MYFLQASSTSSGAFDPTMILMFVGLFALMYFMTIRPQKKRQKEEQEMRNAVELGDEITTIGGIVGKIVTVKEDSLIIETGADRNRLTIKRWSIQANNTAMERLNAEKAAAAEAAKKAKEEKKSKKNED